MTHNKPFGLAASLQDAVALAAAWGPGTRIALGLGAADTADILAPAGPMLQPSEIQAAFNLRQDRYFFSFGNAKLPGVAALAPVLAQLAQASGLGFMPVCLAQPPRERTMYQGHLFEARHWRGDMLRAFAELLDAGVGVTPQAVVAAGELAVQLHCGGLKAQGLGLALLDALDATGMDVLAAAMAGQPLCGGPAWLCPQDGAMEPKAGTAPVAILSGALDRQALFQTGAARLAMPVLDLDVSQPTDTLVSSTLRWAAAQEGSYVIATSVPPDRLTTGTRAAAGLARIAAGLVNAGAQRLLLTGHDTASAVLAQLGVTHLVAGPGYGPSRWFDAVSRVGVPCEIFIRPSGSGGRDLFLFETQRCLNEPAE